MQVIVKCGLLCVILTAILFVGQNTSSQIVQSSGTPIPELYHRIHFYAFIAFN